MRRFLIWFFLAAFLADAQADLPDLLHEASGREAMQLAEFRQLALAQNPTLVQARSLSAQSAGQAKQAGLYPNPMVGYQGEQIRGGSFGGGEQGAFVQQTFVLGGKLGLRRDIYRQQQRAAEIGVDEQKYRIFGDVDQRFYLALAAQQMVHVRRRLLDLASNAVATARQLANVGQADAPDVLQAEVERERAVLDYAMAQRAYLRAFRLLAAVAGKPDLLLCTLAGKLEETPPIDEAQVVERIARESPAVKRATQEIVRAEAELKSSRREIVPDLDVRAGLQQNNERIGPGLPIVGAQGFASAGITLPVFNRNQGNVATAEASLVAARAELSRERLAVRENAEPLLQEYLMARLQATRYQDQILPKAQRAYQLYLERYRQMAATYPQVLTSQRTLFQLEAEYVDVLGNVWRSAVALQNYGLSEGLTAPMP